jgi:hypothetical protein
MKKEIGDYLEGIYIGRMSRDLEFLTAVQILYEGIDEPTRINQICQYRSGPLWDSGNARQTAARRISSQ